MPLARFDLGDLVCPFTRSVSGDNVPLTESGSELRGPACSYPIKDGVPDMRMPSNRGETSYDSILTEWTPPKNVDGVSLLAPYGITGDDITGKVVLLGGTAVGRELQAIRQFAPKKIWALDFFNHIFAIAAGVVDESVKFCCGDLCNLPFKRDTFDVVLSGGVIQHTRSPELAVREMVRCLKPEGKLAIGNFYPPGLHNRRITVHRTKHLFHQMEPSLAKRKLAMQARIYTLLVRTGLWRLHRRFPFPFLLEFCNLPGHSYDFYYENALDYYLPSYRHTIAYDEIKDMAAQINAEYIETRKGVILKKRPIPNDMKAA